MAKPPVPGRIRGRLYQKALKKSHSTPLRVYQAIKYLSLDIAEFIEQGPHMAELPDV